MVAKGYEPTLFANTDPLKGPLEAKLKKRSVEGIPAKNILLGKVLNAKREPMPQAVVSVEMTQQGNTGRGSPPAGTDPIAISDENGEFAIYSREAFDHMKLKVDARGMAPLRFNEVRPGPARRELVVTEGAALRGRVLLNGKPLKDVAVGAVSVDRSENFSGDYEYATNEEGVFYFPNLPPNRPYYVYGIMSSVMKYGAIPAKRVELKGDETTSETGDLKMVPGFRLAGEVRLSDGKPLPQATRLTVSRDEAWDSYTVELSADGKFDLTNMPPESIELGTRVPGYRPSGKNKSLDRLNPFRLTGKLVKDKTNLVMLLEPGENLQSEWNSLPDSERPENLPISGVEDGGWAQNVLRGKIVDATTGEPIKEKACVIPGLFARPAQDRSIRWQNTRMVTAENGSYELSLPESQKRVLIQVLAEDYAPHISEALAVNSKNTEYNVTLTPAKSPSAVLLGVDGQPAAGVKVYLLGPMEQGYLSKDASLNVSRAGAESFRETDQDGRFKLAPKPGEAEIFAATKEGFVHARAKDLLQKIALQPYGRIRGRLVKNGKPVASENIDLGWQRAFSDDRPYINLHGTVTDEDGKFEIANVPPGKLKVTRRDKRGGGGGWTNVELKKFETVPGEEIDLGEVPHSD